MLQISGWLFIAIIQIIFITAGIAIYLFYNTRHYKKLSVQLQRRLSAQQQADANTKAPINPKAPTNNNTAANIKHPAQTANSGLLEEIRRLRERLATSELRIKNLEKFRDLYFKIKNSLAAISDIQDFINSKIDDAALPDELTEKLREAFQTLSKEKRSLEEHIKQVQDQLDVLLTDPAVYNSSNAPPADLVQQQKAEIVRLTQIVSDLELEASAIENLTNSVNILSRQSDELTITVEVLQEENTFLQNQIRTLLQQDNNEVQTLRNQIAALEQKLTDQENKFDELSTKHAELESEYVKIQEKT